MPASVKCPACHTPHALADAQPGVMLLCDTCGEVFDAGATAAGAAAVAELPVAELSVAEPAVALPLPEDALESPAKPITPEQPRLRPREPEPESTNGGSPVLALTVAALVFLFLLGGIGFGIWYIATEVNNMVGRDEPAKPNTGDPG